MVRVGHLKFCAEVLLEAQAEVRDTFATRSRHDSRKQNESREVDKYKVSFCEVVEILIGVMCLCLVATSVSTPRDKPVASAPLAQSLEGSGKREHSTGQARGICSSSSEPGGVVASVRTPRGKPVASRNLVRVYGSNSSKV